MSDSWKEHRDQLANEYFDNLIGGHKPSFRAGFDAGREDLMKDVHELVEELKATQEWLKPTSIFALDQALINWREKTEE